MTREELVYASTMNLLGSDVTDSPVELETALMVEREVAEMSVRHVDPAYGAMITSVVHPALAIAKRHRFTTGLNAACGHFDTPVERELYTLAGVTWNNLQAMIKLVEKLDEEILAHRRVELRMARASLDTGRPVNARTRTP